LFFSHHRDPWNLLIASGGLSICLTQIIDFLSKNKKIAFIACYLFLFFSGLGYYLQNHWTIKRKKLIKKSTSQIIKQCEKETIKITANYEKGLKELQYSWYYDLGPKVLCQNKKINVSYCLND
jgi:uncharacterized membrane protein